MPIKLITELVKLLNNMGNNVTRKLEVTSKKKVTR